MHTKRPNISRFVVDAKNRHYQRREFKNNEEICIL